MERKIIHIDMDAFYAAIEQRDDPSLRGKPVVVGGMPGGRGVVATASYEARKFGIRSAMATSQAVSLCPHAIFVRPNFEKYKIASQQIMNIFRSYSDRIEAVSLDEAYIDITTNKHNVTSGRILAQAIQEHIFSETGLTASAGVAPNKLVAKIASDYNKPAGLTVVAPNHVLEFLSPLAVEKLPGVGRTTKKRLHEMGVKKISDLSSFSEHALTLEFGSFGPSLFRMAQGIDESPVKTERTTKTVSAENTFSRNITNMKEISEEIEVLSQQVTNRLSRKRLRGKTINLKVKFSDFTMLTRAQTISEPTSSPTEIAKIALELLNNSVTIHSSIRLLGVGVSSLSAEDEIKVTPPKGALQLELPFVV